MDNFIEIHGIVKKYKQFTLDNISFDVGCGKIVGFIGENGSGKSTTMKAILDLIKIDAGEVKVFNKNILDLTPEEREDIGVVLDENCLPGKFTVTILDKIFKYTFKRWNSETFNNYLNEFSIDKTKKISELSKGMKAKLNLSIAFSHESKVIILDEPMNGLDPFARDEVMEIIERFVEDGKHSVLISSHIISDLEKICDQIVLIHQGKLVLFEEKKNLVHSFEVQDISEEEFEKLDKKGVLRYKKIGDVITLFAKKGSLKGKNISEATLEDIMLFLVRGKTL